eukprot:3327161-Pleurochrysis_carterae.AAC.1
MKGERNLPWFLGRGGSKRRPLLALRRLLTTSRVLLSLCRLPRHCWSGCYPYASVLFYTASKPLHTRTHPRLVHVGLRALTRAQTPARPHAHACALIRADAVRTARISPARSASPSRTAFASHVALSRARLLL